MFGEYSKKTGQIYPTTIILCLLILFWVMELWRADLTVPFGYLLGGDATFYRMVVKGIIDNGWYLKNQFIGAPHGADLHDFPLGTDNLFFIIFKFFSLLTNDHAMISNFFFLLSFPLTALTALYVLQQFGCSYSTSILASLLYAFLPYHFWRGQGHLTLAAYYIVPLAIMVILWISLGQLSLIQYNPDKRRAVLNVLHPRSLLSIIICLLVISSGLYYGFFSCFFLLVAGLQGSCAQKNLSPLWTAGILLGIILVTLFVHVSPSLLYRYNYGPNPEVARRVPIESETHGLKISQLLLPVQNHRILSLARLRENYQRQAPLVNENQSATLGIIGSCGFLALICHLVCGRPLTRHAVLFNSLSILNISAVLLATMGGFSALFAWLISPQIRSYNRVSVYIAFFSLFATALLLDAFASKWAESRRSRYFFSGLCASLLVIGILDQTSPSAVPPYEQLQTEYTNDANFVALIEATMPQNAIIFQLPYVPFPENNPPVHLMHDYDHFRGYLHSKRLHWSYGTMKGRYGDRWQQQVATKPLREFVETLGFAGFSGIYLDRHGFEDWGSALEARLSQLLGESPLVSANQRLAFFSLVDFTQKLRVQHTPTEWRIRQEAARYPVLSQWGDGFFPGQETKSQNERWGAAAGELVLYNPSQRQRTIKLEMGFSTGYESLSNLQIDSPWFSETVRINNMGQFFTKTVSLSPGHHVIHFISDAKRIHAPHDPRALVFRIFDFRLYEVE